MSREARVKDYYTILGVHRNATRDEIKRAYRTKAKELHPDRSGHGSKEAFQELLEAYEVLSDPEKRREYDRKQHHNRQPHYSRSPYRRQVCRGRHYRIDGGVFDVYLDDREWEHGTTIYWKGPFEIPCPMCHDWFGFLFHCPLCHGKGYRQITLTLTLRFQPPFVHGERYHYDYPISGTMSICFEFVLKHLTSMYVEGVQ